MTTIIDRKCDDVLVAPSGGDYTTLSAAYAAEGTSKRYLVTGAITEVADIVIPDNTFTFFNNTVLTMNGFKVTDDGTVDNTKWIGNLHLTGTGDDLRRSLMFFGVGNYVDMSDCSIKLTPTATTRGSSNYIVCGFPAGYGNKFKLSIGAVTYNTAGTTCRVVAGYNISNCDIDVELVSLTADNPGAACYGIYIQSDGAVSASNRLSVRCGAVISTTGNYGTGVRVEGNYNTIRGTSTGSDAANFSQSGTGNKYGELAV